MASNRHLWQPYNTGPDSNYTDRSGQDPALQWSAVSAFPSTSRDPDEEPDSIILNLSHDFSDVYQTYTPSRIMESIDTLGSESSHSDAVSVSESSRHGFTKGPDDGGTLWTPRALSESSASYSPYTAHTTQQVSTTTIPLVQDHGISRTPRYQDSTKTHSDAEVPQEVSYQSLAEEPPQAVGRNVTAVPFSELGAQVISAYLSNAHSISCLQKFKECLKELKTVMQRNSATADSSLWSAEIPYAVQDTTEELFNPEATGGNSFLSWSQRSFNSLQCSCDDAFGSSRVTATDRPCMTAVREMSEYPRIPGTPGSLPVSQQNTGFSEERDSSPAAREMTEYQRIPGTPGSLSVAQKNAGFSEERDSSPAAREMSLTVSTVKDSNWTRESFCMWVQESLHDSTCVLDYTSADSDCTIPYPVENECSRCATGPTAPHTAKSSICHGSISQNIVHDSPSTTVGQSSEHENSVLGRSFITKRQCSSGDDSSHFQHTPAMQRPESGLGVTRAETASPHKLSGSVSRFQASATLPIFLSSTTRDISSENRDSVLEHTSASSGFRAFNDLIESVPGVVNQSQPHTAKANLARKRKTKRKERQALSDTFSVPNPTHLSMPESPRCRQMPLRRASVQETPSPDCQAKMEVNDAKSNRRQQPDGNSFSQPLAVLLVVAEDSLPSESSILQAHEQSSNASVLCVRQTREKPLLDDEDIQAGAMSLINPYTGLESGNAEFVSTSSFHPQRDRHPPKAESTRLDSPENVKLNIQRPWVPSERPAESRCMPARRTHNQKRHAFATVPEESDPDNGLSSSGKESSWTPGTASYCGSDSDPDTCRKLSRPNKRTTSSSSSRHKRGHTRGRTNSSRSLTRRPRVSDCPSSAASSKKITAKKVPAESQSAPPCDGPRKGSGTKRGRSEPQASVSESVSHGTSANPHHSALPPKKRHCKMLLSRLSKNLWHCGGGQGNASNMTVSYLPSASRTGHAAALSAATSTVTTTSRHSCSPTLSDANLHKTVAQLQEENGLGSLPAEAVELALCLTHFLQQQRHQSLFYKLSARKRKQLSKLAMTCYVKAVGQRYGVNLTKTSLSRVPVARDILWLNTS